jgi:hypothetical protein
MPAAQPDYRWKRSPRGGPPRVRTRRCLTPCHAKRLFLKQLLSRLSIINDGNSGIAGQHAMTSYDIGPPSGSGKRLSLTHRDFMDASHKVVLSHEATVGDICASLNLRSKASDHPHSRGLHHSACKSSTLDIPVCIVIMVNLYNPFQGSSCSSCFHPTSKCFMTISYECAPMRPLNLQPIRSSVPNFDAGIIPRITAPEKTRAESQTKHGNRAPVEPLLVRCKLNPTLH